MKPGVFALLLGVGILAATREPGAAPARSPHLLAAPASPSGGVIQPVAAGVDDHPADGTSSNVNGVLEPGETVQISPFWKNTLGSGQAFTGSASNLAGPPGPSYSFGDTFADYGTVAAGATADCATATGDCYLLTVSGARPVPHWDVTFTETLSILGIVTSWTIHVGESFTDVPKTHPFYAYIEQLFHLQITSGCGAGLYCPSSAVTRAQMAVFLLKAKNGSAYTPPACTGTVFNDVPCTGGTFDPWIEDLSNQGITAGCQVSPPLYCPDNSVTRAQMAVLLLKTEHGSAYLPPACQGIFADVPCPSQFANWIEQLYNEGITGGCGGNNYCPNAPVTRGQMAVFLLRTFAPLNPPVPTPTAPPVTPTSTPVTPTFTNTPITPTHTNTPGSPTPTNTPITPTHTNTPITPTHTNTPITPTHTNTPVTPTHTNTPVTPTLTPTPNTNHIVTVSNFQFTDSSSGTNISTITVGETVEWDWSAGTHSSTSGTCTSGFCTPDLKWDSQVHSAPFSYTHTFTMSGTYPYYCQIHGGSMNMIGTIVVNPAPGTAQRR